MVCIDVWYLQLLQYLDIHTCICLRSWFALTPDLLGGVPILVSFLVYILSCFHCSRSRRYHTCDRSRIAREVGTAPSLLVYMIVRRGQSQDSEREREKRQKTMTVDHFWNRRVVCVSCTFGVRHVSVKLVPASRGDKPFYRWVYVPYIH